MTSERFPTRTTPTAPTAPIIPIVAKMTAGLIVAAVFLFGCSHKSEVPQSLAEQQHTMPETERVDVGSPADEPTAPTGETQPGTAAVAAAVDIADTERTGTPVATEASEADQSFDRDDAVSNETSNDSVTNAATDNDDNDIFFTESYDETFPEEDDEVEFVSVAETEAQDRADALVKVEALNFADDAETERWLLDISRFGHNDTLKALRAFELTCVAERLETVGLTPHDRASTGTHFAGLRAELVAELTSATVDCLDYESLGRLFDATSTDFMRGGCMEDKAELGKIDLNQAVEAVLLDFHLDQERVPPEVLTGLLECGLIYHNLISTWVADYDLSIATADCAYIGLLDNNHLTYDYYFGIDGPSEQDLRRDVGICLPDHVVDEFTRLYAAG